MTRSTIAIVIGIVSIACFTGYLFVQNRSIEAEVDELTANIEFLRIENTALNEKVSELETSIENVDATNLPAQAICDTEFPAGVYRLTTSTGYGPTSIGEYDIHHVSMILQGWSINAGLRVNNFGLPTDFYFDYDGDGRIDTAIAAKLAREIPVAGNTIADRLLADSRVHQTLYTVFGCEWRGAEYTSIEDMGDSVSAISSSLWSLIQENADELVRWIQST